MNTAETLIRGATLVTMDDENRVIENGAMLIRGDSIVALGTCEELSALQNDPAIDRATIDARSFVICPGLINGHIHATGDPLTTGWMTDRTTGDFGEELTRWVLPRFNGHSAEDEAVSMKLAALRMLRTGTTAFIEAGTVNHLDAVVAGATATGIRGRVGIWTEGSDDSNLAIRGLEQAIADFPNDGALVYAWPILVGHSTNPAEVWQAATELAKAHQLGVAAHMSPYQDDPDWYLENHQQRPMEFLHRLDVLGPHLSLTHMLHLNKTEQDLVADSQTNVVLCPIAALRGAFGLSAMGRFPEMLDQGINVLLGSDGFDQDMWRQAQAVSGTFKDARGDTGLIPPQQMLSLLTRHGAKALGRSHDLGQLRVGFKADFVCHDTHRPEWQPRQNVFNQLAWCADGRSVHSVWVNGERVIENYVSTRVDEEKLYAEANNASRAVMQRAELSQLMESIP